MAENSKIEWTDHTFNPWIGCTKVSPACDHCYAEAWAKRSGRVRWNAERQRTGAANWNQPLKWHASIPDGERKRVFCASLADVFDNEVPWEWRHDLFELIRRTPRLDWLLLTKRIGNAKAMLTEEGMDCAYNIWIGATVIDQTEFDRDVPKLLRTPARVRFLSVEPMLGPIEIAAQAGALSPLHWVICGGESGPHARALDQEWALRLREGCAARGIAFFMKQGSQANWERFKDFRAFPAALQVREWPQPTTDKPSAP